MRTTKACLVDLDGTLLDTGRSNFEAYSEALAEVGVSLDRDRFEQMSAGKQWKQFLPALLGGEKHAGQSNEVWRRKSEIYQTKLHLMTVNQALVDLIDVLRASLRIGLVTTASSTNALAALDYFDLRSLFDVIITGDDVARHKPHPEAYEAAAKSLGVSASECLVVEDSAIGIQSAKTFGAKVLCVRLV